MVIKNNVTEALVRWLSRDPDPQTRSELEALRDSGDLAQLRARFAGRLQFGTAGIRGVVGGGPMRMNRLVVRETSAGLAHHVLASVTDAAQRGIVVTFDARPDSEQFARDAAAVFLGAGLRVYLTETAQPTPVGAYGVVALNAAAGVVITASHNPPEYNGYKVYWENGAQIIPPHDSAIAACIEEAANQPIPWQEPASSAGQLRLLGEAFVATYRDRVGTAVGDWQIADQPPISVAYTALHGVGAKLAAELMSASGIGKLICVPEQNQPDGTFPTVAFPNPEEPGAMDAVIALAEEHDCLLACANDPDADRLAVAARDSSGEFQMLTGDQIGVLLGDYCLAKTDPKQQITCASMVSSQMLGQIARSYGAQYFETLTGFKWLANEALRHETADTKFLFAYEEALGYALGQIVRDKDGLSALVAFAQMAAELAAIDQTVLDRLEQLYRQHGLYLSEQRSLRTRPDDDSITDLLRSAQVTQIAGVDITSTRDLSRQVAYFADGREVKLDNFPADVLMYYLADNSRVIVRPSGTEPKTKCYYEQTTTVTEENDYSMVLAKARESLNALVAAHQQELATLIAPQ